MIDSRSLGFGALLGICSQLMSCEGEAINLGNGPEEVIDLLVLEFVDVRPVAELNSEEKDENPSLTSDLLEICFTSKRQGGLGSFDIWCATRAAVGDIFGDVHAVEILNSTEFESSSALSADGLTLWFSSENSEGMGGTDIWNTSRADRSLPWNEPQIVPVLNSTEDDIPRPLGAHGLIMPLGSRRDGGIYKTYLAERASLEADFSPPVLVSELTPVDYAVVDGYLSDDGLLLLYTLNSLQEGTGDLYFSVRDSLDAAFDAPQEIIGLNTDNDERDPWLSADGQRLYFVSDRAGVSDIYEATRRRQ